MQVLSLHVSMRAYIYGGPPAAGRPPVHSARWPSAHLWLSTTHSLCNDIIVYCHGAPFHLKLLKQMLQTLPRGFREDCPVPVHVKVEVTVKVNVKVTVWSRQGRCQESTGTPPAQCGSCGTGRDGTHVWLIGKAHTGQKGPRPQPAHGPR